MVCPLFPRPLFPRPLFPRIETQAALPVGDGCGKDLDWWFGEEARNPKKRGGGARPDPVIPDACKPLLSSN